MWETVKKDKHTVCIFRWVGVRLHVGISGQACSEIWCSAWLPAVLHTWMLAVRGMDRYRDSDVS